MPKNEKSPNSFWREHARKNTRNLKATVSISPKILQLECSLPNIVEVDLSSEFSQLVRFLTGADPGFFLGGGAPLRSGLTDW